MTYRVTAPYVTLKVRNDLSGLVLRGFYAGSILPAAADADDLARHLRKGMVEEVEAPAVAAEAPPAKVEEPVKAEDPVKAEEPAKPKAPGKA